ncbi:MAG: copper amine oxidase N-terminal domain-containing protein [Marinisporobacter sp.]|jgi:hypothetical protein|nr:copper amine oxidase N-terminal domain-containing protein [Marinisporobacter sp.]
MKRKISLLLVLSMMLTLVPMGVFAATDNGVNKVPQVKDDYKFTDKTAAPQLRIEESNNDEFGGATSAQTFRMKLENAEWLTDSDISGETFKAAMGENGSTVYVTRLSDTTVEATVYGDATTGNSLVYTFPMLAEAQGTGALKVTVDPRDSVITGGTYTFANAADGDTVATIDSVEDFTDNVTIKDIQIDETKIGAIGSVTNSKVKLKLPTDFKWLNTTLNASNVTFTGGLTGSIANVSIDGRNLEFTMTTTGASTRGTIYLKGLQITANSDADYGDVEVNISGDDITDADLTIAKYVDYEIEIKADGDANELIAGRKASSDNDDAHELETLIIEETVANAWLTERKTRIEFPSWVKILRVDNLSDSDNVASISGMTTGASLSDQGDNYVEFTVAKTNSTKTTKLALRFFVSVEAGRTGDITAEVTGRSLTKDAEVVLGKAVAPVTVEAEGASVRTGIKNQEIGEITIKEGKAEAIKAKKDIEIVLDENVEWKEVPTIKVAEGNLDLDIEGADVNKNVLTIPVDSDSSKPATIVISGAKIDLDRTVAEGDIDVKVGGSAIVENYDKSKADQGFFTEEYADEDVAATVVTPADNNTQAAQEVKFVIGNAEYQVGEEVKTADVAPYIADGRTMLSLRFVAEAVGVADENIIWDGETRTVTIFKGDRIAQVEIGSNKLFVNGVVVPMDTEAVIKDGRTMLPIRFIAQALGAEVEWDGATRTVTVK